MTEELPFHAVETIDKGFAELGLEPDILKVLEQVGFEHPTPIQAQAIPIALRNHDVMGCAQTGSGKTAAFVLPIVQKLTHGKGVRGLILCPTREIALQTKQFCDYFGKTHQLETTVLIGGVRFDPQIRALKRHPDIIVATPGRLMDHMERRNVSLEQIEELVLDEADRMLDMGFYPQIEKILKRVPPDHRTMMFSATMPMSIRRLAEHFLKDPRYVEAAPPGTAPTEIEHRLYLVEEQDRQDLLLAIVKQEPGTMLIFTETKRGADGLVVFLREHGEAAQEIHSDLSQRERIQALERFKKGEHTILVATDVMARGIDVSEISQVISYQVPENPDVYVHRAGRTGRAGKRGVASIIGNWRDKATIATIEQLLSLKFSRCTIEGIPAYVERETKKKRSRLRGW